MENKNIIGTNFIITNRDLINEFGVNTGVMLGELYGRKTILEKEMNLNMDTFLLQKTV